MNISGIVVAVVPSAVERCLQELQRLPGVFIHGHEPDGRVIVTQETASTDAQEEGLRTIQALAGVVHAALVYHYFEGEQAAAASCKEVP